MLDLYNAQMVARDEYDAMTRRIPVVSEFATPDDFAQEGTTDFIGRVRNSLGTALVAAGNRISLDNPTVTGDSLGSNSKAASRS